MPLPAGKLYRRKSVVNFAKVKRIAAQVYLVGSNYFITLLALLLTCFVKKNYHAHFHESPDINKNTSFDQAGKSNQYPLPNQFIPAGTLCSPLSIWNHPIRSFPSFDLKPSILLQYSGNIFIPGFILYDPLLDN